MDLTQQRSSQMGMSPTPEAIRMRTLSGSRPEPDFKIISNAVKAYTDAQGVKRIKGTASSTIKDLHGDRMAESAIGQMAAAASDNMTIFLNHSYDLPEDVFGSVAGASVKTRGEFVDLDFDIVVDDNPRAMRTYDMIDRGRKLGISIGGIVLQWSQDKNDEMVWIIEDILLLEASIVGIPANPRSWVDQALKSFLERYADVDDAPFPQTAIATKAARVSEAETRRRTEMKRASAEPDPPAETQSEEPVPQTESAPEVEITAPVEPTPELLSACPSCGGDIEDPLNDCTDEFHTQATEPATTTDVTAGAELPGANDQPDQVTEASAPSQESPDEVTASAEAVPPADPAQEAPQSDPGSADHADPDQVSAALEKAASAGHLSASLAGLVKSLLAAYTEACEQRDAYAADLKLAIDALDRVLSLPIGRKTSMQRAAAPFREKARRIYGDEFAALVDKHAQSRGASQ